MLIDVPKVSFKGHGVLKKIAKLYIVWKCLLCLKLINMMSRMLVAYKNY